MSPPSKASSSTAQSATVRRLLNELREYNRNPRPEILDSLGPVSVSSHSIPHQGGGREARDDGDGNEDDLFRWEAVLKGVDQSAYQGGRWKLMIRVPENYPLAPPDVSFSTRICHPNIDFKTGEICLDLLKTNWSPAYSIAQTLVSIHQLLTDPEPDSPLNLDVAALLRAGDVVGAEELVRYYTRAYRWDSSEDGIKRTPGLGRG